MKMDIFWVIVPYSLVEVYQHFKMFAASIVRVIRVILS
jgi:hypothetical protein